MSPKLFEYKGIEVFFYASEHLPIHVHAYYGSEYGMKVEFILLNEKIKKVEYKRLKGRKLLLSAQLKDLKNLINHFGDDIVNDWISFFILKKTKIKLRTITKTIK
jgi:hypothetical protein